MGRLALDLKNQVFGRLTCLDIVGRDKNKDILWKCQCSCENKTICYTTSSRLRSGATRSCGCYYKEKQREAARKNYKDLCGMKFGKLIILEKTEMRKHECVIWKCQCSCENKTICYIRSDHLLSGKTKSCGCYNLEIKKGNFSNFWRDGRSKLKNKYPKEWTEKLRERIRNRDNRKCQYSDCIYDDTKEQEKLHVHHIDGNKFNCKENNLISLCGNHHMKIEHNDPNIWMDSFYNYTESFI